MPQKTVAPSSAFTACMAAIGCVEFMVNSKTLMPSSTSAAQIGRAFSGGK